MLSVPTPFPQVGSYALFELDGRTHLVRLVKRNADNSIVIAFPLMPDVASGNRTVELAQLIDATPLSEDERAEQERMLPRLLAIDGKAKRTPADRAKLRRSDALRARAINAETMSRLIARLPDRARRTSVVGEAA